LAPAGGSSTANAHASAAVSAVALEEAVQEREPDELGAAPQAELSLDARTVELGRPHREMQEVGDLAVRMAEREQTEHLALAAGESVTVGGHRCKRPR